MASEDLPKISSSNAEDNKEEETVSSEPEGEEDTYVVESILDKRVKKGHIEYLIKWKNYDSPNDNTWEPKGNCQCPELIEAFEKKYSEKRDKEKEKSVRADSKTRDEAKKKRKSEERSEQKRREKDGSKENVESSKKNVPRKSKEIVTSSDESDDDSKRASSEIQLPEPAAGKQYLLQQPGNEISSVIGVKRGASGGIVALVKFQNGAYELVPTSLMSETNPKVLIEFYESRLRFF